MTEKQKFPLGLVRKLDKNGKLNRKDKRLLSKYIAHFEAMPHDVRDTAEVRDELEWLAENGLVKEVRKDVFAKTKDGKALWKVIQFIERKKVSK